jgi:hypothetical protein
MRIILLYNYVNNPITIMNLLAPQGALATGYVSKM